MSDHKMPNPTPELDRGPRGPAHIIPTSFRFLPETLKKIDDGAKIFKMNRTKWLEFLVDASVAGKRMAIETERARIEIELVVLNPKRRRPDPNALTIKP